ncbi:GNAT family N-acetyltransferase [Flavobacterium sp. XGLA_31]|uniref:GNAT family N-acetyltransferase n=1 Tax=Flavobacterium sp. XGLA_31 TaxID=3447666 RepID=UPI003F2C4DD6
MISITPNTDTQFIAVRKIAQEVWPVAYGAILSKAQLEYMMEMMYSITSLQQQAANQKHFILAQEEEEVLGFASYELNCEGTVKTKIHKLYVLTTTQGKGIGKMLMDYIEKEARLQHQEALFLNVNKYNKAQDFYRKIGFTIAYEEVINIGQGYVMDDFVMEKPI